MVHASETLASKALNDDGIEEEVTSVSEEDLERLGLPGKDETELCFQKDFEGLEEEVLDDVEAFSYFLEVIPHSIWPRQSQPVSLEVKPNYGRCQLRRVMATLTSKSPS
jgi:hypothetical protein